MHTNYRRKQPRYHVYSYKVRWRCFHKVSLKGYRRERSTARRREERYCIHHGKWDKLKTRYPRDIAWEF